MQELFSKDIAKDLGLTTRAIQKYIQDGFLPGTIRFIGNRKQYIVSSDEYFKWKNKHFQGLKKGQISKHRRINKPITIPELQEQINIWLEQLRAGTLNGRVYSDTTIEIYQYFIHYYLDTLGSRPKKPIVSKNNLREVFAQIPGTQYATKQKLYDSTLCFAKFLVDNDQLTDKEREALKDLKPRRFLPPKRITLSEKQIETLIQAIGRLNGNSQYDKALSKALIIFMSETGLRASEVCNLKLEHIDLENNVIYVVHGKNKKNRKVGITFKCNQALLEYLEFVDLDQEYFFLNTHGKKLNRDTLRQRLNRLSRLVSFDVTCHSFRRSFVTNNVKRGRSLVELQLMAGHSDIKTTRDYCTTTVDEVVEGMRGW